MNGNYANYEEQMKRPEDATQTGEVSHEENIQWQEQVKEPVDATETVETVQAVQVENIQPQLQVATPEVVESGPLPWLKKEEIDELRSRWNAIQIEFVNEPRKSVEQADALVADALTRIEQMFTNNRTSLNEQWVNHQDISTEDLRIALQSYRSFFNRLLAL